MPRGWLQNVRPMLGKLLKLALFCGIVVAAFQLGQVFALADPDTIRLEQITRYDDVAISGDMFILVEYTLEYAVLPTENISQGWLGRLIDVGGSGQLASVQPFAGGDIPDLGYSRGAYGFYFQDEPAITGTLRVTLEGNPSLSPTPTGIFSESVIQRSAADLAPDLRAMAIRFEDIWNVDLISPVSGGVNRYTSSGEHYFSSALPNLRNLAPDMFTLQSVQMDVPDRTVDTVYTNGRIALLDGTPLDSGFESLADFLNVSEAVARFIVAFALAIAVAALVGRAEWIKEAEYATTLQIWCGYIVLCGGFWLGLVTIQVLGLLLVIPIVVMAIQWNLNRTGA